MDLSSGRINCQVSLPAIIVILSNDCDDDDDDDSDFKTLWHFTARISRDDDCQTDSLNE